LLLMMMSRSRAGDIAALFSGAALPLAFAPFDLYPLAVICLAVLFATWLRVSPMRAGWRGLLFGLGMFGFGINWVFISMNDFGGMSWPLSAALTALLIVVMALFPALAGYVAVRLVEKRGRRHFSTEVRHESSKSQGKNASVPFFPVLLIFPAVWTLFEWIRGWFLTGFPWLNLGYSQIDAPLAGLAPLAGVYGVSLAVAVSAALLLALWNGVGRLRGYCFTLLTLLWLSGAALALVDWTRPAGEPLTVSLVQGNVPQDLKWHPGMRDVTLEIYAELTRAHLGSDLIVWPETAVPMFEYRARPFLDELAGEARAHGSELLVGVVYMDLETERYYNSLVTAGTDPQGRYHKHHLVPFTEYLPFKSIFGDFVELFDIPMSDFSAGDPRQPPLELAGQRIALSICYEDAFGEEIIRALPEATLLINVSNDAWFGDSIAPHQHLQIARMRAAETGRYLARGTNTGISAFIGPRGELLSQASQFELTVLTDAVEPRRGATLYVLTGNWLPTGLAVLMLVAGVSLRSRAGSTGSGPAGA
jgi:apolipoprotein N-acyltransferase